MTDDTSRDVSADPRVAAALAVVRGFPASLVADQQAVPEESVERWAELFLRGGAARVAGTADPDPLRAEGRLIDLVLREVSGLMPALCSGVPDLMDNAVAALDRVLREVRETADLVLGRIPLTVGPTDLAAIARDLEEPGRVNVRTSDAAVVTGDAPRLAGAILAMVETARHEGTFGVPVVVRIDSGHSDRVEVSVEQPGALTPARARRLLEPFAIEGLPESSPPPGAGLGLYLARSTAVAHGGILALDLEDDGAGARTIYRLRLPVAGPPEGPLVERITTMKYTFACGDVMPGCAATFEAGSVDEILAEVVPHAAADHGITEVTPEIATAVQSNIKEHP